MTIRYHQVDLTTNGSGAATVWSQPINGELLEIQYVKGSFDNGSTITMTGGSSGRSIWAESNVNSSTVRAPRQACHNIVGVALVYAGTDPVTDVIHLAEAIKIVIASGGASKTASFRFVTREG